VVVEEKPPDGRTEGGNEEPLAVVEVEKDSALGTVRVVKRVVVDEVVVVESVSSSSPLPPVGLGGLAVTCAEVEGTPVAVTSVMGQTVVLTAMVSVVTWPILPGQSVTVAAQLVMVYVVVVYTVDVVQPAGSEEEAVASGALVEVSVTGQTVVDTAMVSVTTWPGQSVTVGGHDVAV
jgi:hypothetical protein